MIIKMILFIILITVLIMFPGCCPINGGGGSDHIVSLKLNVIPTNNASDCNYIFNRTDFINICYTLTNMREDSNAIATTVTISTDISNILEAPKETVNLEKNDDGEGFSIECNVIRNCANKPICVIDSVEVNPEGHLEIVVKNLHPMARDIVCFNYSTKISKNAPTEIWHKCSDIKMDDVNFTGHDLDLKVEDIFLIIVILLTFYLNELINPVTRITHFSHPNEL